MEPIERIEVDYLLLADRAEMVNGKLYAMGAAWDRVGVADFTKPIPLSIATAVLVPWSATNRQHQLILTIRDADGVAADFRVEWNFAAGRPAFLNGETQRMMLAIPDASVVLPHPGNFVLAAAVDGEELKAVRFSAQPAQPPPGPPPPGVPPR